MENPVRIDNNSIELMKKSTVTMPSTLPVNNSNLPNHLIIDHILPRLPVKSLLRFKSVSKSWFSTISSPIFAKFHLEHSSSRPQFLMLPLLRSGPNQRKCSVLHYDECDGNVKGLVQFPFNNLYGHSGNQSISVIGSSNGLVCLLVINDSNIFSHYLVLWNPAIHHIRNIALPYSLCGRGEFCYVKSINDYKICFSNHTGWSPVVDLCVFTLSTGRWDKIDSLTGDDACLVGRGPVLLIDETMHFAWLSTVTDVHHRIEFNIATGEIKRIPWRMNWLGKYNYTRLSTIRGRLSLLCMTNSGVFDVWKQKQHNDWNSWEKCASLIANNELRFLSVSPNGKGLFLHLKRLKVVDLSNGNPHLSQEGIDLDDCEYIYKSHDYVESLISPFVEAKDDAVDDKLRAGEMEI